MKKSKKTYIPPENIVIELDDNICDDSAFLSLSMTFKMYDKEGLVEGGMAREERVWDTTPASSGFDTW
ncbi:MAG: hypothetical protein KBT12_00165 [Bacteroidales bacterium]|nr:hypothetical protein [Candidatus Physcousia equi]